MTGDDENVNPRNISSKYSSNLFVCFTQEDDENSQPPSATMTENTAASGRARRPLMAAKWDRIMKRREAERRQEENVLKDVPSLTVINSYDGHRNARTMIKEANFWSDSYVMSGSDCG